MKNKTRKLITALVLMCVCMTNLFVYAALPESEISPQNIAIIACDYSLTKGSLGKLECFGATEVQDGYTAYVLVELQQHDGSWTTIKSWSDTYADYAYVLESHYVESGYSYRLKTTHKAYTSSGSLVETFTYYTTY